MDEEMMSKLALLRALQGSDNSDGSESSDDSNIYVSSVHDATALLQQHMLPNGARYRKRLVEYITNPENRVLSNCNEYHNLVMDLFRVGDYDLALKVCEFALDQSPNNQDIIGDAIKACGDSSQFEKGETLLETACQIPREKWNFRLFLYGIDFLKTKLSAYPTDEDLYKRSISLAEDYIHYFPFDEHGYNQKAELLLLMNKRNEAISELNKYIFEVEPDQTDSKSELITAQCCVTLLNILDDSNDYDFIIKICEKGLRNTTQEQPSAAIGFFMYRKALALDAKAHTEDFRVPGTVSDALRFYQAAYDLNQGRSYMKTIEQRYAVLRPYAKDFDPLVKRSLYITESMQNNLVEK